jgi:peptidyl-prolyl cis-trans isomerase D
MGFMEKMRSSTAPILWVLVVAFGVLFMLQDTQVFDAVMAGPRTMGEVDGRPITSEQFNQRLNSFTEQHRQQTGNPPNREQLAQYQEFVWDQMVVELALQTQMENIGIKVTDAEIRDAVFGDNPDPIIRQFFTGPDGNIDRGALRAFIEAEEAAADLIIIEQQIRERRMQEKINQYVQTSVFVTDREVERDFINNNTRASVSFVRFPFSDVSDDEITVSDSELRAYHRNNSNEFKQDKTWRFRYVSFSLEPTSEDTVRTLADVNGFRDAFAMAENDSLFLLDNFSQTQYDNRFRSPDELRPAFYGVFDLETGEVSEAAIDNDTAVIYKKTGTRNANENYVRSQYIRLNFTQESRNDRRSLANEIVSSLQNGADFSEFIRHSNDSRTAARGGDTGFITADELDNALARPLFRASEGSVVGPIEHDGAFHIYRVNSRTNQEVSYVTFGRLIEADPLQTIQAQQNLADEFREDAIAFGFEDEAARAEYTIQEATATKGNPFIVGLGESRLTKRAIAHLRRGSISETVELDDQFLVILVDEVREEGVRPLDEVRSQVEAAVKRDKRRAILVDRVRSQFSGHDSLEAIAEVAEKQVQTAANVRMSSNNISGAGREPGLIGAIFAADTGVLKGPKKGENAVFFFKVDEVEHANTENLTDSERERIRNRLLQQKTQVFTASLVDQLRDQARIRDHRRTLGMMQ